MTGLPGKGDDDEEGAVAALLELRGGEVEGLQDGLAASEGGEGAGAEHEVRVHPVVQRVDM